MDLIKRLTALTVLLILLFSCNEKESYTQINPPKENIATSNSSGGVIDGGGSGYEYPTLTDIEDELDFALKIISTTEEERNFSIILNDFVAKYDYDRDYDQIYPEDELSEYLLQLVGPSTNTIKTKLKYCARENDLDECIEKYPFKRKGLGRLVHKGNVKLQDKCFDLLGNERIGSVDSFSTKANICLSKAKLLAVPKTELRRNILALLFHEATHMIGLRSEYDAEKVEKSVLEVTDLALAYIQDLEKIRKNRKIKVHEKLWSRMFSVMLIHDAKEYAMGNTIDYYTEYPHKNFNFYTINQYLIQFFNTFISKEYKEEVNTAYSYEIQKEFLELRTLINKEFNTLYFINNKDQVLGLKSSTANNISVFTEDEKNIINSQEAISYDSDIHKSIIDKYNLFAYKIVMATSKFKENLEIELENTELSNDTDFILELREKYESKP